MTSLFNSSSGSSFEPKTISSRVVILTLMVAALSIYAAYTANIVALLQSTTDSIQTLQDLLDSQMKLATHGTVYYRHYFKVKLSPCFFFFALFSFFSLLGWIYTETQCTFYLWNGLFWKIEWNDLINCVNFLFSKLFKILQNESNFFLDAIDISRFWEESNLWAENRAKGKEGQLDENSWGGCRETSWRILCVSLRNWHGIQSCARYFSRRWKMQPSGNRLFEVLFTTRFHYTEEFALHRNVPSQVITNYIAITLLLEN